MKYKFKIQYKKYIKFGGSNTDQELGITSSTNSSNNREIQDFLKFPIIRSRTEDGLFEGDGARGNGYCSIWSILIGWSLLNRNILIINEQFLGDTNQPINMNDLVNIIINTAKTLNNLMGENTTLEIEGFTFSKGELEMLIFQLELPYLDLDSIQGRAQFQILALLLGVEIKVHDESSNIIDHIGNPEYDTIRVSTNGIHYHIRNNRQDTNLDHFTNRYWWNLQWVGLEEKEGLEHLRGKQIIPYIQ
tara:strand:+ start:2305 stop:3045 length:741 start_codon:yes stop_codon:yes gene_type:complete